MYVNSPDALFVKAEQSGVKKMMVQAYENFNKSLEDVICGDLQLRALSKQLFLTNIVSVEWESYDSKGGVNNYRYCWSQPIVRFEDKWVILEELTPEMIKVQSGQESQVDVNEIIAFLKKDTMENVPIFGHDGALVVDSSGIKVNTGYKNTWASNYEYSEQFLQYVKNFLTSTSL